MKANHASILLEKYQHEKRKRILRYSSKLNQSQVSTVSTQVTSVRRASKFVSDSENFEMTFVLSSLKSDPMGSISERKFYLDGAEKFVKMKENRTTKASLKTAFVKTDQAVVHKVSEKLAAKYLKALSKESKNPFEQAKSNSQVPQLGKPEKSINQESSRQSQKSETYDANSHSSAQDDDAIKNSILAVMTENMMFSGLNTPVKGQRPTQIGGNRTSIVGVVRTSLGEEQNEPKNIKGEGLPFTMKEFPEDVNPPDFFTQKQTAYHSYVLFLRKNISFVPTLTFYHFHKDFHLFFSPMTISIKTGKGELINCHFPLCATYFLMNTPEVVQLYFAHEMVLFFLNRKKSFPRHIRYQDFDHQLSRLSGEVDFNIRLSVLSKKSIQRKSMFSNHKVNFVFEDVEEANEIQANTEVNSRNDLSDKRLSTPNPVISPFQANEQNAQPTARVSEIKILAQINSESKSFSDSKSEDSESSEEDEEEDSESNSSEEDSLEEAEYDTKNPFVLKYSKAVYKFQTYEIKVIPPMVSDQNGRTEKLTCEMLYQLLYNFNHFDYGFFEE